ncbi:MAG: amino acid ABC transporter substrate-binding protein [Crenarchaeota archaeon]|nr:amino acid ABC transporter substrate-binding protein [Thermoproteota archaeon]
MKFTTKQRKRVFKAPYLVTSQMMLTPIDYSFFITMDVSADVCGQPEIQAK